MTDIAEHTTRDLFTPQETEAARRFRAWVTAINEADKAARQWAQHEGKGFSEARAYDECSCCESAARDALESLIHAPIKVAEDAVAILAAIMHTADLFGPSAHGMGLSLRDFPDKLAFYLPADIFHTYRDGGAA